MGGFEPYPQAQLSVEVRSKPPLESLPSLQRVLRAVQQELDGRGRVLVRYSGTEPKLRVLVESEDPALAESAARTIAEAAARTLAA